MPETTIPLFASGKAVITGMEDVMIGLDVARKALQTTKTIALLLREKMYCKQRKLRANCRMQVPHVIL